MQSRTESVKEIIVGAIVGVASMLPGISGATLCVVFGIYERLIRDLAHLREWLVKDIRFIICLAAGVVIGTVLAAKVLDTLMESQPVFCLMLFVGLIVGQVPLLMKELGTGEKEPVSGSNMAAFAIGFGLMVAMIIVDLVGFGASEREFTHDLTGILVMFAVGIIIAVSMLLPGLSHSTVLVVLGLFGAFTSAISNLDLGLLVPMALGAVAGVLMFSKLLHRALTDHHRTTMFLVMGLTIGSIVSIFVTAARHIDGLLGVGVAAVAFVIGIGISYLFSRIRIEEEPSEA